MSIVIKHGNKFKFKKKAYIGRKVLCRLCGCVWKLEADNEFDVFTGGHTSGLSYVLCPECGNTTTDQKRNSETCIVFMD